ncbi:MFS transporter [Micromonospora sp. NPDC007220]|uniref:MFS transporter n=1 Tax=Micromonospora sp. NPDC007220 TaxID=3154318 RepID=UPI0033E8220C
MTTQATLSSPKPDRPTAEHITAGAGWRLGLLYGPAVYGVSAAAVALPDAARHLHASGPALAWLLTAYAVGIGVGAVTAGRTIDLWGDRPVLLIAVTLLAAGTLACVMAPNLTIAVAGRILLAVGSGAVKAVSLATAARLPAPQRPTALARFGACLAAFGATAPLAGALAAAWSWRVALALPVLSIAAIPLCWPLTTPRRQREPLDGPGAGLLAAVAAGLLLTARTAAQHTSALTIAVSAAATVTAALALALRSRRTNGFVVDGVLAAPWFRRAALAGAGVYAGLFAVLYAAPHLLTTLGYSTMGIGLLLLPGAAVGAGLARGAAVAARRLPARHVLTAASLLLAGTLCYAALDPRPLGVAAAATAAFATSATAQMLLTAEITRHVTPQQRGGATGLLMLAIFTGGGGGTALCAALWQPCGPSIALALAALLPAAAAAAASRLRP